MTGFSARRGRYRQTCLEECLSGDRRGSKLEAGVFQILSFVLPGGEQDVCFPDDRRLRVDMVFTFEAGLRLAIEYDGAYWHAERVDADRRKAERLVGSGFVDDLVRLREDPLEPTSPDDVWIPRGATVQQVAGLTLLHLSHHRMLQRDPGWFTVQELLSRRAHLFTWSGIRCDWCREMALDLKIVEKPSRRRSPVDADRVA
jgi:hypothetical protein